MRKNKLFIRMAYCEAKVKASWNHKISFNWPMSVSNSLQVNIALRFYHFNPQIKKSRFDIHVDGFINLGFLVWGVLVVPLSDSHWLSCVPILVTVVVEQWKNYLLEDCNMSPELLMHLASRKWTFEFLNYSLFLLLLVYLKIFINH